MVRNIYFSLLFLYSFILSDLNAVILFKIGNFNFYGVDLIHVLIFLSILIALKKNRFTQLGASEKIFYIFLILLIFQIFRGFVPYGFRSVGEARYIVYLYMSFIPFVFFNVEKLKESELHKFIETTIYIAGLAGLLMFIIEYTYGGRFYFSSVNIESFGFLEDARGIRYLDVYHVYNMVLLAIYIIMKADYTRIFNITSLLLAGILILATLITQARTPIISLLTGFVFLLLIKGKVKLFLYSGVIAIISFFAFMLIAPNSASIFFTLISDSFSVIIPQHDYTGTGFWRWAVNVAALEQAFEKFWIGQGYGGYFYFNIPVISPEPVELPPHNLYIIVFLKTGIIGLFILCLFLFSYIKTLIMTQKYLFKKGYVERSFYISIILLILVSQVPYGLGYGFIQLIGLYAGFGFILLRVQETQFIKS